MLDSGDQFEETMHNAGSAVGVAPLPAMFLAGVAAQEQALQQGLDVACGMAHAMVGGYFAGLRLMMQLPNQQ